MGHEFPMRSRNYAKEIGLNVEERQVPVAVAAVVFLLVAAVALLFARQVNALHHTAAEPTHAPAPIKVSSR